MVKKMMGLPPGTTTTSSERELHAARLGNIVGNGLAQVGQAGRRSVVRITQVQRVNGRFHDVLGRVEIGLADFEMDDVLALLLQGAGTDQNFKSGLGAKTRHALGQVAARRVRKR